MRKLTALKQKQCGQVSRYDEVAPIADVTSPHAELLLVSLAVFWHRLSMEWFHYGECIKIHEHAEGIREKIHHSFAALDGKSEPGELLVPFHVFL